MHASEVDVVFEALAVPKGVKYLHGRGLGVAHCLDWLEAEGRAEEAQADELFERGDDSLDAGHVAVDAVPARDDVGELGLQHARGAKDTGEVGSFLYDMRNFSCRSRASRTK